MNKICLYAFIYVICAAILFILLPTQVFGWVSDGIPWEPKSGDEPNTYDMESINEQQEKEKIAWEKATGKTARVENQIPRTYPIEQIPIQEQSQTIQKEDILDNKKAGVLMYIFIIGIVILFISLTIIYFKLRKKKEVINTEEYNELANKYKGD